MWTRIQELILIAQTAGPGGSAPQPSGTGTDTTGGGGQIVPEAPSMWQPIIMMGAVFAVFYFILIRPQNKQRQRHQERVSRLKKGDHVITGGGIHGTIVGTRDEIAVVKIAEGVKIEVQKGSISGIVDPEGTVEAPTQK